MQKNIFQCMKGPKHKSQNPIKGMESFEKLDSLIIWYRDLSF